MIEAFSYEFFRNALLVGLLASIACGIIGTYVVLRRISFISGSIAHSAFGGIGLGYYLGINPLFGAVVFALASALGIGIISRKQRQDTAIGAIWALGMSIGILFIYLTPGYAADLFTYLFGNILMTSQSDLILILFLDLLIVFTVALFYRAFLAVTFDEEYAELLNLPVLFINLVFLSLIAFTVVILVRVVGIILVIALLTLPAATAELFSSDLKRMMLFASLIGMLSTAAGILLSYLLNLPSGPLIVFATAFLYLLSFSFKKQLKKY